MRMAAIVYIVISVVANFIIDHFTVFVLAMFSFPVLIWLLLRREKSKNQKPVADITESK